MKRERNQESDHHQSIAMANYLMLLSEVATNYTSPSSSSSSILRRVFECKTCNRQFSSFQALGGHKASHKKPRTTMIVNINEETTNNNSNNNNDVLILQGLSSSSTSPSNKPKTHECSICGLEFAVGQALGGHMRKHRVLSTSTCENSNNENLKIHSSINMINNSVKSSYSDSDSDSDQKKMKKKDYLLMDLNLTPWENDLEILRIKKTTLMTPFVDCFY